MHKDQIYGFVICILAILIVLLGIGIFLPETKADTLADTMEASDKYVEAMRTIDEAKAKPAPKPVAIPVKPKPKQMYYFTHYDLGDYRQNDKTPCIGASGKDLCKLERSGVRTMALTSDIRKKMGIKFGDTVKLEGDKGCQGTYQVHDEMNKRFRTRCIIRKGTGLCIKGDIASMPGGRCSVTKIK